MCFALAKSPSHRRDAENKVLEMREESGDWKREEEKRWNGADTVEIVDRFLCEEDECALIVAAEIVFLEGDTTKAYIKEKLRVEKYRRPTCAAWRKGKKPEASAGGEKSCRQGKCDEGGADDGSECRE